LAIIPKKIFTQFWEKVLPSLKVFKIYRIPSQTGSGIDKLGVDPEVLIIFQLW
jgi:hypothetical protein